MAGEAPVEMDGAAGRADLAVVLSAYRSLAEGRVVDLESAGLAPVGLAPVELVRC